MPHGWAAAAESRELQQAGPRLAVREETEAQRGGQIPQGHTVRKQPRQAPGCL